MPAIVFENMTPSELAAQVNQLDPKKRNTVKIQEPVDRKQLAAELKAIFAECDEANAPSLANLSEDEIMVKAVQLVDDVRQEKKAKRST